MKKVLKSNIFWFLFGALIFGMIGGVSAVTILSKDIAYQPKGDWNVSNVEQAIDSLYMSKTSDNYSTDEKAIGTWIDGKTVYQKVVATNSSFFATHNIAHGITNPGEVVSLSLIWHDTTDNAWADRFRYYEASNLKYNMFAESLKANATYIIASDSADNSINWANRVDKIYFIIKYTKA